MSNQIIKAGLLAELSTEQQQVLTGGRRYYNSDYPPTTGIG